VNLQLMQSGQNLLTNLLSENITVQLNSFKVSASGGIALDPNGNGNPTGALVYQGNPSQIKYTITSPHEITFIIYLDDTIGGFNVGNVMLYLNPDPTGTTTSPVPFLWISLDTATEKDESDLPNYIVGSRLLLQCAVEFPYITNAIDLSSLEPFQVQLEVYKDETILPSPYVAEYDQYTIDTHTLYDAATLVIKDTKNGLWWAPLFSQCIDDPDLGVLRGGIVGISDFGSSSTIDYLDGSNYKFDNSQLPLTDGGNNWLPPNQNPIDGGSY
jgi:hypothetical protein